MEFHLPGGHAPFNFFNHGNQFGLTKRILPVFHVARTDYLAPAADTGISPQALLDKRLASILQPERAVKAQSVAPDSKPPTSEQVAQQVLNDVNQKRAKTNDISQIRDNIEQGFEQTLEALRQFGQLSNEVFDEISDTYALIQDGLDRIDAPTSQSEELSLSSISQSSSYEIQRSLSTSLQIETAEGDIVTIDLSRNSGAQLSASYQQDVNGYSYSSSQALYSDSSFQYSVTGDLSEEETNAIKNLVEDVSKVADKFFDGNLQSALKKTRDLNEFGDEISSYNLELTYDKIISTQSQAQATFTNAPQTVAAAEAEVDEVTNNSPASGLFNNTHVFAKSLFDENIVSKFFDDDFVQSLENTAKGLLQDSLGIDDDSNEEHEDKD